MACQLWDAKSCVVFVCVWPWVLFYQALEAEQWRRAPASCQSITARTSALHAPEPVLPCIVLPAEVMSKVLELEGTATHWSLFNRFVMAAQMLDAADAAGEHTQGVHAAAGMGMGMPGHF